MTGLCPVNYISRLVAIGEQESAGGSTHVSQTDTASPPVSSDGQSAQSARGVGEVGCDTTQPTGSSTSPSDTQQGTEKPLPRRQYKGRGGKVSMASAGVISAPVSVPDSDSVAIVVREETALPQDGDDAKAANICTLPATVAGVGINSSS